MSTYTRGTLNVTTGNADVTTGTRPPEEDTWRDNQRISLQQQTAARRGRFPDDIPANENSLPAIRDKVNEILAELRGV